MEFAVDLWNILFKDLCKKVGIDKSNQRKSE